MTKPIDPKFLRIPAVRVLLGCDFGTKILVPGVDDHPCVNQAVEQMVIYDNGEPLPVMKFCAGHIEFLKTQTDEHK